MKPNLSFQQFIQRRQVIGMYRKYMRLTQRIADKTARRETREWVRGDFDRYKHETDTKRIDVLLAQASRQYKELESGVFSML